MLTLKPLTVAEPDIRLPDDMTFFFGLDKENCICVFTK